jgi:hypothetical protein
MAISSTAIQQGGAAQPVVVVSGQPTIGGPAQPVYVVTSGPVMGGGPMRVVAAAVGAVVEGGPAIPVYVISGSLNPDPNLSGPAFAAQNTPYTNDMGPDGYSWAQAGPFGPLTVDQYGKLITISENSGGSHAITYSNDLGSTWADGPALGFLTRGAAAYNSLDDTLEVIWNAQAATDGILYRRYRPTRDGSNNITTWTALNAGYAVIDAQTTGSMVYEHPCILWLNDAAYGAHGAVVMAWAARNTGVGGVGNEIRAVMRTLTNTAADGVALNWANIGIASVTTIGNAPGSASYTALVANATNGIPHPALIRLANSDLFLGYHNGTLSGVGMAGAWQERRATWAAGSNNWTALTAAITISNLSRAGTDTGYISKGELLSKPRQDSAGNIYLGIATWKSNADGDTWGYAQITPGDVVTLVDVYSALGAHSYAPDGDIDYDTATDRLIVSYITTVDQDVYVQLFNGLDEAHDPLLVFDAAPVDIPLIHTRAVPGKLAMLFRDTSAPFAGYFGTIGWST